MESSVSEKTPQFEWPSRDLSSSNTSPKTEIFKEERESQTSSDPSPSSSLNQERKIMEGTEQKKALKKPKSKKLSTIGSFRTNRRLRKSTLQNPSDKLPHNEVISRLPSCLNELANIPTSNPVHSKKPVQQLLRSSSLRLVRTLKVKGGSKTKRSKQYEISHELGLERATCSSALKGLKLPGETGLDAAECESVKVCPYIHCSLHGHHHTHHHHIDHPEPISYLSSDQRKGNAKINTTTEPGNKSINDFIGNKNDGTGESEVAGDNECSDKSFDDETHRIAGRKVEEDDKTKRSDDSIEFYAKTRMEPFSGVARETGYDDLAEILFGVKSSEMNSCNISEKSGQAMEDENSNASSDSISHLREETRAITEVREDDSVPGTQSTYGFTGEGNFDRRDDSRSTGAARLKKTDHLSMWQVIHKHVVLGLQSESQPNLIQQAAEKKEVHITDNDEKFTRGSTSDTDVFDPITHADDAENQEIEIRKMFAIKLVREAIEKILLPEVQDDQSVTSEVVSDQGLGEKDQRVTSEMNSNEKSTEGKEEDGGEKAEKKKENKSPPKRWSYLKKVILLSKFVKELEKVKKISMKVENLNKKIGRPISTMEEVGAEQEKISLRPQTTKDKGNVEEWMLDYAVRKAVSQLAPSQKRKVALLVKAFESVASVDESTQTDNHDFSIPTAIKQINNATELDKSAGSIGVIFSNNGGDVLSLDNNTQEQSNVGKEAIDKETMAGAEAEQSKISLNRQNHLNMWHVIYRHVVTDIAVKVGPQLFLHGSEEDEEEGSIMESGEISSSEIKKNHDPDNQTLEFSKSDAEKLVREAMEEILHPEVPDDTSHTQPVTSELSNKNQADENERVTNDPIQINRGEEEEESRGASTAKTRLLGQQRSKNWNKLKRLLLVKRSLKALEQARTMKILSPATRSPLTKTQEAEKVDLRKRMTDERKKAEDWMLDYAVQHIVTKLTPARKRRVTMLVEAFEAVVPLPEA